ncbi:Lysine-specific demethylase lid, partial [Tetrabaena socialis]
MGSPTEAVKQHSLWREAPTFRPREEEWADPLKYLASIRDLAEPYGICKIVPPKEWKPPCALVLEEVHFPTRRQKVHELQHRDIQQAQADFYEDYDRFLHSQGKQLCKWKYPQFLGRDICISVLHRAVQRRGGYEAVTEHKQWREVAKVLQ